MITRILAFFSLCQSDTVKIVDVNSREEFEIDQSKDDFNRLFPLSPLANFYITDLGQRIGIKNAQLYYETHVKDGTMKVMETHLIAAQIVIVKNLQLRHFRLMNLQPV